MRHPDRLFSRPVEKAQLDPRNPGVLEGHLACAAYEAPLLLPGGRAGGGAGGGRGAGSARVRRLEIGPLWLAHAPGTPDLLCWMAGWGLTAQPFCRREPSVKVQYAAHAAHAAPCCRRRGLLWGGPAQAGGGAAGAAGAGPAPRLAAGRHRAALCGRSGQPGGLRGGFLVSVGGESSYPRGATGGASHP